MSDTQQAQTHRFQTEDTQLLDLVINSLYGNKDVFLRELVSNASDAIEKRRFLILSDPALGEGESAFTIRVDVDQEAGTVTITDNGIGMTYEEVIENIGTIAKSGTREFLGSLTGDQTQDSSMIGQFGVGFYSAFIVAKKVVLKTRRAGLAADQGVRWESNGAGEYTIEHIDKPQAGTEIILFIKPDETEYVDEFKLRQIVTTYSDHIAVPVEMLAQQISAPSDEEEKTEEKPREYETVNRAKALWTLSKSEIKDEDYHEFYKHISHDFQDPLLTLHNRVEGKLEYTSLLYIPAKAPFDLWHREHQRGLKLYVQRVFIMDEAEQFLPHYLRFVKGVVDSNDLPLNVSRELLQSNRTITSIRNALVKRILGELDKLAANDAEKYQQFWDEFGQVLKEGPAEDFANRENVAKLLRFASTHGDSDQQNVSLESYVSRMQEGQEKIYYVTADSYNAAKYSPHLEVFRKQGIEVLLLSDRVDEWLINHLSEFEGKTLQSVAKGDLDLGDLAEEQSKEEKEEIEKNFTSLIEQVKGVLGDKVKDVRITYRLTDSPACIVADDQDMSQQLQRMLQAAGQDIPSFKPIFELNPKHALVTRLHDEQDDKRFAQWTEILFDQAVLAEGAPLDNPAGFVKRLNQLILELAG